ncbi:SDR family oxidoreductase, partial [Faecalibacterium prausnitzii]
TVLLPAILQQAGRIDCLIGSAGGMGLGRITEMSDDHWRHALDSNLNSAFASARACLPELVKTGGNLLFVASIASLAAGPQTSGP